MKLTHALYQWAVAGLIGLGAAQTVVDVDLTTAVVGHTDYAGRIYTAAGSGGATVLRTENKRWHVWWTQPITWPAGAVEGDIVTVSFGVRVTNPGESFLGTQTAARVVADQADLCELTVSEGSVGMLFAEFLQPTDSPRAIELGGESSTFRVPQDTTQPLVLSFQQNCDAGLLTRAADFEIQTLRLEVQSLEPEITTTTTIETTETTTITVSQESTESTEASVDPTSEASSEAVSSVSSEDSSSARSTSVPVVTTEEGPSTTPLTPPTTTTPLTPPTTTPSLPAEPSTTTPPDPASPGLPPVIGDNILRGCVGSTDVYEGFELVASRDDMDLDLCVTLCNTVDKQFSGAYDTDCYCSDTLAVADYILVPEEQCDVICPGNDSQNCGGLGGEVAVGERGLETRQSPPITVFLTIYIRIRGGGGASISSDVIDTVTATTTVGGSALTTLPGASTTVTATSTATHTPARPDWWFCQTGYCDWEVIILKPWPCDGGCDDGLYYELVCDRCGPGEEFWRPIRCAGGSCRGKTLCRPETCRGGFCGDFPIVREETCDVCEGGISYRPQPRKGQEGGDSGKGHWAGKDDEYEIDGGNKGSGGVVVDVASGSKTVGGEESGSKHVEGGQCGSKSGQDCDDGFVIVSGTYMSVVDTTFMAVMGIAALYLA